MCKQISFKVDGGPLNQWCFAFLFFSLKKISWFLRIPSVAQCVKNAPTIQAANSLFYNYEGTKGVLFFGGFFYPVNLVKGGLAVVFFMTSVQWLKTA